MTFIAGVHVRIGEFLMYILELLRVKITFWEFYWSFYDFILKIDQVWNGTYVDQFSIFSIHWLYQKMALSALVTNLNLMTQKMYKVDFKFSKNLICPASRIKVHTLKISSDHDIWLSYSAFKSIVPVEIISIFLVFCTEFLVEKYFFSQIFWLILLW